MKCLNVTVLLKQQKRTITALSLFLPAQNDHDSGVQQIVPVGSYLAQRQRGGQPRLQSCLMEIRRLTRKRHSNGEADVDASGLSHKVHTCSINNFPTAARLASSAVGYACQVYTLSRVMGVEGELSVVSRQGSGSACRSMYVGFVQWIMGQQEDGKDSLTQQVEPETHWPELRVLILVVSAEWKPVGSTSGMQTSVETSSLLKHRADAVVPARMKEMIEAVHKRNFTVFAELTMKDSIQFHATCLDTYPPIFYLNDVSHRIINLVHRYNHHYRETKAGPGPCVVEDPSEHLLGSDGLPKKGARYKAASHLGRGRTLW